MRPVSWSSSYLLRDPLGISTTTGTPVSRSVADEAVELIALDLLAPVQEAELDEGGDADDLAAEPFDQPGGRPGGAAGGEHVVDDQHPLAGDDRVGVELKGGGAVLQRVLLGLHLVGQLAGLADGHEAGAEVVGDRRGEDEAARLDADHLVDVAAAEVHHRLVDHRGEGDLVGEQRGDVLEHDALLWEVRHVADQGPQALDVDGHDAPPCRGGAAASGGGAWPGGTPAARTTCAAAGPGAASGAGVAGLAAAPGRPPPGRRRRRPRPPAPRGRTRARAGGPPPGRGRDAPAAPAAPLAPLGPPAWRPGRAAGRSAARAPSRPPRSGGR